MVKIAIVGHGKLRRTRVKILYQAQLQPFETIPYLLQGSYLFALLRN